MLLIRVRWQELVRAKGVGCTPRYWSATPEQKIASTSKEAGSRVHTRVTIQHGVLLMRLGLTSLVFTIALMASPAMGQPIEVTTAPDAILCLSRENVAMANKLAVAKSQAVLSAIGCLRVAEAACAELPLPLHRLHAPGKHASPNLIRLL